MHKIVRLYAATLHDMSIQKLVKGHGRDPSSVELAGEFRLHCRQSASNLCEGSLFSFFCGPPLVLSTTRKSWIMLCMDQYDLIMETTASLSGVRTGKDIRRIDRMRQYCCTILQWSSDLYHQS